MAVDVPAAAADAVTAAVAVGAGANAEAAADVLLPLLIGGCGLQRCRSGRRRQRQRLAHLAASPDSYTRHRETNKS